MTRIMTAFALIWIAGGSIATAQVVTYYPPAVVTPPPLVIQPGMVAVPTVVARVPVTATPITTYYAPRPWWSPPPRAAYYAPVAVPVTTYYAPAAAPVTAYLAPAAQVAPASAVRTSYASSVSSMPLSTQSVATITGAGTPIVTYRPVVAVPAPSGYIYTRGLFGRPQVIPVP